VQGKYDYQVSCELARQWVELVEAPAKGFFMFENSAHAPNMEEPEKFVKTVREIMVRG
jgi:pimeloyl-ACP methyl ester carboxylesterase